MAQRMTTPHVARDNQPISIFKHEGTHSRKGTTMATKKATMTTTPTEQQNGHQATEQPALKQATREHALKQSTEQVPKTFAEMSLAEQRATLKEAGLKRCPTHLRLLDRLPDEAKQPVAGYEDVSIRPLSAFSKSTSSCKPCDHLLMHDARERAKQGDVTARTRTHAQKQARVEKLTAQMNALAAEINRLETELRQESEQEPQK